MIELNSWGSSTNRCFALTRSKAFPFLSKGQDSQIKDWIYMVKFKWVAVNNGSNCLKGVVTFLLTG